MLVCYHFTLLIFVVSVFYLCVEAACHNDCNGKGRCSLWGTCQCFTGWSGNDCSRKNCPTGPPLSDVASALDSAHTAVICSNQGSCDYSTGICSCNEGFTGASCSATKCFNDCSGKGQCVSLRAAAQLNDGYLFNRTTTYNKWDADVIFGCKCDYGYSGADCSQRSCEYGPDPRLDVLPVEKVTLVCDCTGVGSCLGRFKLRFLGTVMKKWLYPGSSSYELATAIMETPGIFARNAGHVTSPVFARNITFNDTVCASDVVRRTEIFFKRNQGDLPALSFYANSITHGSIYFEVG
jgi:hypothetical protein